VEDEGRQRSRACPNRGSRPSLFLLVQAEGPTPSQEGSSWGLSLHFLPCPTLSGHKEAGPVPRAASGPLASALFSEALPEGDCLFLFLFSRPCC